MRIALIPLFFLCFLFLLFGFAQAGSDLQSIPLPKQWPGSEPPPSTEAAAPFRATWTASFESARFGPVLTDEVAVISWCSQDSRTCYLQTFDLTTGKPANKTEWSSRLGRDGMSPYLYSQSSDTFIVNDGELLIEYGSDLKPRSRMKLPAGMGLAPSPGYGYSDWLSVTNLNCPYGEVSVFNLSRGQKLIVGCGAMGVLDDNWKLVFAESYAKPNGLGWPTISRDGGRFVLPLGLHYIEPPLHKVLAFLLYDLRGKATRKIVVRTADQHHPSGVVPALSPDGTKLALLEYGRLSLYTLPK